MGVWYELEVVASGIVPGVWSGMGTEVCSGVKLGVGFGGVVLMLAVPWEESEMMVVL